MTDSKLKKVPTEEELDLIVNSVFPDWSDYCISQISGGLFNTVFRLERRNKEPSELSYILRCGPCSEDRKVLYPYEKYLMDAENWAYERFHEVGIPTSVVVKADTSKTLVDRDFMIVECIPSKQMSEAVLSDEDRHELERQVGFLCRRMNDITCEKFGRVGNILHGKGYDRWSDHIGSEIRDWVECAKKYTPDYYSGKELDFLVSLNSIYRDVLDEITVPQFCHCDIWSANVLIPADCKPQVLAIIDPDRAMMGDPDFELASNWMMTDAFYEGYGRRPAKDRNSVIRYNIYAVIFLLLDGYFLLTQYDDPKGSGWDKERAMKFLYDLGYCP